MQPPLVGAPRLGGAIRGTVALTAVGLAALVGAPLGCDNETLALLRALGEGCLLDSDCAEGLICVFRVCHHECQTSVDCPLDAQGEHVRCMLGDKPDHYCQLEGEVPCTLHSECPGAQVCGRDQRCRDTCETERDCVVDQLCAQHTCALPTELGDDGKLPLVSGQGPLAGATCDYDSECKPLDPAFVCRAGACDFECKGDVDCVSLRCDVAEGAEGGLCAPPTIVCVPGQQVACDCLVGLGVQVCNAEGSAYGPCENAAGDCAP